MCLIRRLGAGSSRIAHPKTAPIYAQDGRSILVREVNRYQRWVGFPLRDDVRRPSRVGSRAGFMESVLRRPFLRNQHVDETKKVKTSRKGQGADEVYKSKWVYFESLKFLSTETNVDRKTVGNLTIVNQ